MGLVRGLQGNDNEESKEKALAAVCRLEGFAGYDIYESIGNNTTLVR